MSGCCPTAVHEAMKLRPDFRDITRFIGYMPNYVDEEEVLELRNCACLSTLSIAIPAFDGVVEELAEFTGCVLYIKDYLRSRAA